MAKQLQDAEMPPRAAVVNGGSLSPRRYEELWQREKLAGGKVESSPCTRMSRKSPFTVN